MFCMQQTLTCAHIIHRYQHLLLSEQLDVLVYQHTNEQVAFTDVNSWLCMSWNEPWNERVG